MLKSHKNKAFGLIACITVAITSIQLSEYLGIHLLGFEKSPISPIMIAIIIGISIANFNSIIINELKPGLDFCIKVLLKIGIILCCFQPTGYYHFCRCFLYTCMRKSLAWFRM